MRSFSKIGLIMIIVGIGLLNFGFEHGDIIFPLAIFAVGGFIYLFFDSEDK